MHPPFALLPSILGQVNPDRDIGIFLTLSPNLALKYRPIVSSSRVGVVGCVWFDIFALPCVVLSRDFGIKTHKNARKYIKNEQKQIFNCGDEMCKLVDVVSYQ